MIEMKNVAKRAAISDTLNGLSDEMKFYIIGLIVVCVIGILWGILKYKKSMKTNPALTKYERWCVKLSCFLSALNGNLINSLAVWPYTGRNSGQIKKSWGIANRDDYENLMSKYKAGDRCQTYDQYVNWIKADPNLSDQEIATREKCSANKLAIVRETYPKLTKNSILAFDYGTYAYLTRVAYNETLLNKEEALKNLREAGALSKSTFSSWEEFGYSYYAGAAFSWADSAKDMKRYKQTLDKSNYAWKSTPFAWKDEA